ncbi:MAG: hypothetical protein MJ200_03765 [Mycoplasmoidaceae bacterium]|nr:hypothetical protein [Mycoplasmoidaceae bacterium]
MKKAKLILGTIAPIAGLSTILPIVACNKHEQDKIIPIPIDEYIIENGIIKGLKQQ